MKVRFLDLSVNNPEEKKALLEAADQVFSHGWLVAGPELQEFETKIATLCNRRYAVGVSSGTDALYLALRSLDIGPGDEVITTALSWVGTANAIAMTGATPVFADICDDLNIDPNSICRLLSSETKAIMPVHFTGRICNMTAIKEIACENNLAIIEDAAQAFGSQFEGCFAGAFGDLACFSLNPMKVYGALGEAGVIVMDDVKLRDRLVSLRYNGTVNRECCLTPSANFRMDTLQAAFLLVRFEYVFQNIRKRQQNAKQYNEFIQNDKLLTKYLDVPQLQDNKEHIYYTYTIQCAYRDDLKAYLERCDIEVKIQHSILMPDQPAYQRYSSSFTSNQYPHAKQIVQKILCLPVNEKITIEQIRFVVASMKSFYESIDRK